MGKKKIFTILSATGITLLLAFSSLAPLASASPDDIVVVRGDGSVDLVETGGPVLAATTDQTTGKKQESKPAPAKVVNLVPAHTDSTVHIGAKPDKDKKIKVTITQNPPAGGLTPVTTPSAPTGGKTGPTTAPTVNQPSAGQPGAKPIEKAVDQVVAEDANGKPVLTVKSGDKQNLAINQESITVSTALPLSIDTVSHRLSVVSPKGEMTKVSVLPAEAVSGMWAVGLLNNNATPSVTLTQERNQTEYKIEGQKSGKLFGVLNVSAPTRVDLSVETGKILRVDRPLLFSLLGPLIK